MLSCPASALHGGGGWGTPSGRGGRHAIGVRRPIYVLLPQPLICASGPVNVILKKMKIDRMSKTSVPLMLHIGNHHGTLHIWVV